MKVLIAYGTRHGTTEYCAKKLEELIRADIDTVRLEKGKTYDLSSYDMVVIGSPVYTGSFLKEVTGFLLNHRDELSERRIGLYVCCITPVREAEVYLRDLFPAELVSKACATGIFGGAFDFQKMSVMERFLIRRVKKVETSVSTLSEESIALFARAVQEVCPES